MHYVFNTCLTKPQIEWVVHCSCLSHIIVGRFLNDFVTLFQKFFLIFYFKKKVFFLFEIKELIITITILKSSVFYTTELFFVTIKYSSIFMVMKAMFVQLPILIFIILFKITYEEQKKFFDQSTINLLFFFSIYFWIKILIPIIIFYC